MQLKIYSDFSKLPSFYLDDFNCTVGYTCEILSSMGECLDKITSNITQNCLETSVRIAKAIWDCTENTWGYKGSPRYVCVIKLTGEVINETQKVIFAWKPPEPSTLQVTAATLVFGLMGYGIFRFFKAVNQVPAPAPVMAPVPALAPAPAPAPAAIPVSSRALT